MNCVCNLASNWRMIENNESITKLSWPVWKYYTRSFIEVKVKSSLCCNLTPRLEDVLDSGGIVPRILNLGTGWRWVVSFIRPPLYPHGRSPWHPLDRRLDVSHNRSGRGVKKKNSKSLPGLEPPIIQPLSQPHIAELSRLQFHIGTVENIEYFQSE
jgi:hypothetical protein